MGATYGNGKENGRYYLQGLGFRKIRGTLFGFPMIRTAVFGVYIWVPLGKLPFLPLLSNSLKVHAQLLLLTTITIIVTIITILTIIFNFCATQQSKHSAEKKHQAQQGIQRACRIT